MSGGIPKRSVIVAGHRTSISVEAPFWAAVLGAAAARQLSINDLISEIAEWAKGQPDAANLSSAVRLWVLARAAAPSPVAINGTTVGVVAGKLTYTMPGGATVCCTCIGEPYSEQIVEGLRRRAAAVAVAP